MANDFLPFAVTGGADVVSQADWVTLLAGVLQNGFVSGVANSGQLNKAWRQSSVIAHAVAQAMADVLSENVLDDGDTAAQVAQLKRALQFARRLDYVTDSGAANAYVVALVPAVTAYLNGMSFTFKAVNANSGASTLNAGGGAKAIKTNTGAALAAGDIPAASLVTVLYDLIADAFLLVSVALSQTNAQNGQCQLTKSGANLLLLPFNGNKIVVNGTVYSIADAGVTLAVGAALTEGGTPAADTTYYIYAYITGGAVALQASATGHSAQAGTGIQIRTGDATRTLVGMARTTGAPAWVDSAAQRYTRSWYNRISADCTNVFAANRSTTSATYAELSSGEIIQFIAWQNETALIATSGKMSNTAAGGQQVAMSIGIDSAVARETFSQGGEGTDESFVPAVCGLAISFTEGYHYATILGKSLDGSTCTWAGSGTAGTRTTIFARVGQ